MQIEIKEKVALFQLNSDDTETRVGKKNFDTDKEALEAVKEEGTYILYKVLEVTKKNK